jgi:hypothetical protein
VVTGELCVLPRVDLDALVRREVHGHGELLQRPYARLDGCIGGDDIFYTAFTISGPLS